MNRSELREGLLAAEGRDPILEARYREQLRSITERRLTAAARVGHVLGLTLALVSAVRFVQWFAQGRAAGRPEALAALGVGLAFSLGWALAEAAVLRAGAERLFSHGTIRMQLIVVFAALVAGLMLWAGLSSPDPGGGTHLVLFGLVFWCAIGLPFLVGHLIRASEVRVRMSLLWLELALDERANAREPRS